MAKPSERLRLATSGEELGAQLLHSVREMKAGLRGRVHVPEPSGIVEARQGAGLSQASFAALLGVSVRTDGEDQALAQITNVTTELFYFEAVSTSRKAALLGLRILAAIGHFAVLLFALLSLVVYGSVAAGIVFILAIFFAVMNLRLIFPWPLKEVDVLGSRTTATFTLWCGLLVGSSLSPAGAFGAPVLEDWWIAFAILALTSALNLLLLRSVPRVSPGNSPPHLHPGSQ